jgi:hypothetical protein
LGGGQFQHLFFRGLFGQSHIPVKRLLAATPIMRVEIVVLQHTICLWWTAMHLAVFASLLVALADYALDFAELERDTEEESAVMTPPQRPRSTHSSVPSLVSTVRRQNRMPPLTSSRTLKQALASRYPPLHAHHLWHDRASISWRPCRLFLPTCPCSSLIRCFPWSSANKAISLLGAATSQQAKERGFRYSVYWLAALRRERRTPYFWLK